MNSYFNSEEHDKIIYHLKKFYDCCNINFTIDSDFMHSDDESSVMFFYTNNTHEIYDDIRVKLDINYKFDIITLQFYNGMSFWKPIKSVLRIIIAKAPMERTYQCMYLNGNNYSISNSDIIDYVDMIMMKIYENCYKIRACNFRLYYEPRERSFAVLNKVYSCMNFYLVPSEYRVIYEQIGYLLSGRYMKIIEDDIKKSIFDDKIKLSVSHFYLSDSYGISYENALRREAFMMFTEHYEINKSHITIVITDNNKKFDMLITKNCLGKRNIYCVYDKKYKTDEYDSHVDRYVTKYMKEMCNKNKLSNLSLKVINTLFPEIFDKDVIVKDVEDVKDMKNDENIRDVKDVGNVKNNENIGDIKNVGDVKNNEDVKDIKNVGDVKNNEDVKDVIIDVKDIKDVKDNEDVIDNEDVKDNEDVIDNEDVKESEVTLVINNHITMKVQGNTNIEINVD